MMHAMTNSMIESLKEITPESPTMLANNFNAEMPSLSKIPSVPGLVNKRSSMPKQSQNKRKSSFKNFLQSPSSKTIAREIEERKSSFKQ
jgi:hypothetical protein